MLHYTSLLPRSGSGLASRGCGALLVSCWAAGLAGQAGRPLRPSPHPTPATTHCRTPSPSRPLPRPRQAAKRQQKEVFTKRCMQACVRHYGADPWRPVRHGAGRDGAGRAVMSATMRRITSLVLSEYMVGVLGLSYILLGEGERERERESVCVCTRYRIIMFRGKQEENHHLTVKLYENSIPCSGSKW